MNQRESPQRPREVRNTDAAVASAMIVAGLMIANHVGGRAVRDALFLSRFDITTLPLMIMGAAFFAAAVLVVTSRIMSRIGPQRLVPAAFGVSGVLLLAEWGLLPLNSRIAAVAVYLHLAVVGSFLISGFWSLINEAFDPRTAKKRISRIAGAGTVGGLLGGALTEVVAPAGGIFYMLPLLSLMHLLCGWSLSRSGLPARRSARRSGISTAPDDEAPVTGWETLRREPYLRNLAILILMGTSGTALIDYVFKSHAVEAFQEPQDLLRFFALFYTGTGLLTFLLQSTVSRRALERMGIANTVAVLPAVLAAGGLGAFFLPGLASAATARAGESVVRSSLFRSGYELLYTPIAPRKKRSAKSLIDVGFERMGDALGGGLARVILLFGTASSRPIMLLTAVGLSSASLIISRWLHGGYVGALESSLLRQAVALDLEEVEDKTTRQTLIQTMASLPVEELRTRLSESGSSPPETEREGSSEAHASARWRSRDPLVEKIAILRSGQPDPIVRLLDSEEPLEASLIPHVITLLAWEELSGHAIRALRPVASKAAGQLVDALVDPDREFAIRRRIPRVLAVSDSPRAREGLWEGLHDRRFEVRFQCGWALSRIRDRNPEAGFEARRVFQAVQREVSVSKRVWESQRLLDRIEEPEVGDEALLDEFLRSRTSRSLEHVFSLLSLVLPRDPLKVALRGLLTDDPSLRGTALEYLESTLPEEIQKGLWPFLQDDRRPTQPKRSREKVLEELMRSNQSIEINLSELRQKSE